jgi:acetolactate synthase-1/2/3 large subunit
MSTSTPASAKVHQAIARSLTENGVTTIFGLMGDANMYFVDSFIRDCDGRFIAAAHEAGATMMALGYAALSERPGVCSVTHGPGMTNTVTGLIEGVKGSLPLVLICGDTDVEDRENPQNVSQREFAIDAGAGFEQLRSAKTVAEDVARVLRRALVERRPVVLNVPMELDWKEAADYKPLRIHIPDSGATVTASDDLDSAIGIIATAKRPIILAGRGATSDQAKHALLRLAKRIDAPMMTTLKAKDLFRGEEFNLGICGTVSTPAVVETVMESDCIVAFGASLNKYTLSHGTFLKGKRIIQVNVEPAELGKNMALDAGLVGDPAAVADLIVHWLDEAEVPPSGFRTPELQEKIAAEIVNNAGAAHQGNGALDYRAALHRLDRMLPQDRVLVTDGGRFMVEAWKCLSVPGARSFLTTINYASIGLGLSHAIGASYAVPGRPVVVVCGDGGFMHGGLSEFNTAVRYNVDLIVVVCNDGAYGAEHFKFLSRQMSPNSVLFDWPDLAPVAIALGGEGVTVKSHQDWAAVEQAVHKRSKPLLIDIKLDPLQVPWDR